MTRRARSLPVTAGVLAAAGLSLAACSSATPSSTSMMGGGGSGYVLSPVSCPAPASLPGARVEVTLTDMGMTGMMSGAAAPGARMRLQAAPASVPAGVVSIAATNRGWRTHELVVMPLADGVAPGEQSSGPDGKVSESGSLGEASAACVAGTGDGIPAGSASWVTFTLSAGRYDLICNLTDHYADGMHQLLTVT